MSAIHFDMIYDYNVHFQYVSMILRSTPTACCNPNFDSLAHSMDHYLDYYPGALYWNHCYLFEKLVLVNSVYG